MAISRAQLLKELLPGLNALFGLEYKRYGEEHKEIYETETSERSFEEETKLSGFSAAPVKNEGQAIAYDNGQEAWSTRYQHRTIALGFSITEEAIEDNLYEFAVGSLHQGSGPRYGLHQAGQGCFGSEQRLLVIVCWWRWRFAVLDLAPADFWWRKQQHSGNCRST